MVRWRTRSRASTVFPELHSCLPVTELTEEIKVQPNSNKPKATIYAVIASCITALVLASIAGSAARVLANASQDLFPKIFIVSN